MSCDARAPAKPLGFVLVVNNFVVVVVVVVVVADRPHVYTCTHTSAIACLPA